VVFSLGQPLAHNTSNYATRNKISANGSPTRARHKRGYSAYRHAGILHLGLILWIWSLGVLWEWNSALG
jgi:hypothetical protein